MGGGGGRGGKGPLCTLPPQKKREKRTTEEVPYANEQVSDIWNIKEYTQQKNKKVDIYSTWISFTNPNIIWSLLCIK